MIMITIFVGGFFTISYFGFSSYFSLRTKMETRRLESSNSKRKIVCDRKPWRREVVVVEEGANKMPSYKKVSDWRRKYIKLFCVVFRSMVIAYKYIGSYNMQHWRPTTNSTTCHDLWPAEQPLTKWWRRQEKSSWFAVENGGGGGGDMTLWCGGAG